MLLLHVSAITFGRPQAVNVTQRSRVVKILHRKSIPLGAWTGP
jgi:hypothetical protein